MIQKALGVGKDPVVLLQPVAMGHILLQTGAKTVGNGDGAVALGRFRCGDDVLSAETLIALVYRQGFLFKVDVRRRKRQQLSLTDPCVVHGHKYRVAGRPVFHDLNEGLKLLPCPEQHFIGVFLTHTSRFMARILFQPVILDCVVENRRELVVDALEIGLGVRLAVFIPVAGQGVLPLAHVNGLDLVQRDFLEERRYLQVNQPFLTGASGDTELFEKASNINGFQGGRVANNLYISPFRATVFKTAALFLYLNSSVVIRVRKPLFFPL